MARPNQPCAKCQKSTNNVCGGCNDAPTNSSQDGEHEAPTYYCSSQCLKADREAHQDHCRRLEQRKVLYRAGSLLRRLHLAFREQLWDNQVVGINTSGDLAIIERSYTWPSDIDPNDILILPFPSAAVIKEEDRAGVLCARASQDSFVYLQDFYRRFLSGIARAMEEVACRFRVKPKHYVFSDDSGEPDIPPAEEPDIILKVTMKGGAGAGEEFALDVSGSQFGFTKPVAPWSTYFAERGCEVLSFWKSGFNREKLGNIRSRNITVANHLADAVLQDLLAWEAANDISARKLFTSSAKNFDSKSNELFEHLHSRIRARFEEMHVPEYDREGVQVNLLRKYGEWSMPQLRYSHPLWDPKNVNEDPTEIKRMHFLRDAEGCTDFNKMLIDPATMTTDARIRNIANMMGTHPSNLASQFKGMNVFMC